MTLVANSRRCPISRSLGKMGPPGRRNPGSQATRANSPPVSLLGLGLIGAHPACERPRSDPGPGVSSELSRLARSGASRHMALSSRVAWTAFAPPVVSPPGLSRAYFLVADRKIRVNTSSLIV